jgi:hypothetical protein
MDESNSLLLYLASGNSYYITGQVLAVPIEVEQRININSATTKT